MLSNKKNFTKPILPQSPVVGWKLFQNYIGINNFTMVKSLRFVLIWILLLFCSQITKAQFTVTGIVTDKQTAKPLVGVNIFHQPSNRGAVTDNSGKFSIDLPGSSATLRFSYVGYQTQKVEVNQSNNEIKVRLTPDIANLQELVVTGLATSTKRENLANDVTTIDSENLNRGDPSTVEDALSGKIPGVNIKSTSGAPGGGFNVQMRGISTLGAGSSQPLYIIDGVYVNNASLTSGRSVVTGASGINSGQDQSANRLADINPDDIETIEVLKGPSAAAIYGERANAGVVIITTKRGSAGATKVSISQDVGYQKPRQLLGYSSWSEEQIKHFYPENIVDRELNRYREAKANGKIHDYEKILYDNTGIISGSNLKISGGNEQTKFYVSGGYHTENGIINNTGFNRGTFRANIDHNLSDKIQVTSNSNLIKSGNKRGFTGNQNGTGGSVGYALSYTPAYAQLLPDAQGIYPDNPYFADNPLAIASYAKNNQEITRFIQSLSINADLYRGDGSILTLKANGGFDYLNGNTYVYLPEFLQNQKASALPGDVIRTKEDNLNINLLASLVSINEIGEFSFNSQIGFSRYDKSVNRQQVRGQGLVPGQDNVKQAQVQSITIQSEENIIDVGWFGQEKVNWDNKLIGTIGLRMDRSSLNFDQGQYYFFPKASLAANITNFGLLNSDKLSQLKLRVAYGETGGLPDFGDTFLALNGSNIGNQLALTISSRDIDPNLKPETAQEIEFGTDIGLFDNSLSFTATYYIKQVEDLILDLPTASSTGITAIATNAANLTNKGIELGLSASLFQSSSFSWSSTISFWKNQSEITSLGIPPFTTGGYGVTLGNYLIAEGFSPTTIVGPPRTPNKASLYTVYGHAQPDFEMSFSNQFALPFNFQLNFLLHWSKGNYNINTWYEDRDEGGTTVDWGDDDDGDGILNGEERQATPIPASSVNNASYLWLKNIDLKYSVPASFLNQVSGSTIKQFRFGISASNVFMWSPYYGYGIQGSDRGANPIDQALVLHPYPSSRKILFHINIDL